MNKSFQGCSKSKSSRINEWVLINKSVRWYKDRNVWKSQWTDVWNNKNRILKEGYAHVTKRQNAQNEGQDPYVKNSLEEMSYSWKNIKRKREDAQPPPPKYFFYLRIGIVLDA